MKYSTIFTVNFLVSIILVMVFVLFERQSYSAQATLTQASEDFVRYKNDTQSLYRLLIDRESGQRGYIITGDKVFLEPYFKAGQQIAELTENIKPSLNATEYALLIDLIKKRTEYFQTSFEMVDQQQPLADFVAQGEGRFYMNSMRDILEHALASKQQAISTLQNSYDEALAQENWITTVFLTFIGLSNLGFLGFAIFKIAKPKTRIIRFLQAFSQDNNTPFDLEATGIAETDELLQHLQRMTGNVKEHAIALETTIEALENEKRHKDMFLANMSHELRTPLNGIYGALQIVKGANNNENELLSAAKECTQALSEIISDILDSQKMSAGKFTLDEAWYPCEDFLLGVTKLHAAAGKLKSIDVNVSVKDLPNEMYCDKTRLGQILNNVIGNAVKFTDQGCVDVHVGYADSLLTITVTDNGIGMNEQTLSHLFDRFSQANPTVTRHYRGTGLGMSITKQLVDLMKGSIDVTSTLGKGSTFVIRLPMAARGTTQPLTNTAEQRTFLQGLRILLIDDIATNLMVAKLALEQHVSYLDTATNGQEALEKIATNTYDVVISDIRMPTMDGEALLSSLRQQGNKIPVIALTAVASETEKHVYLGKGFAAVLNKPLDVSKLLTTVMSISKKSGGIDQTCL
jgi:signal transduction histidine kinase/ActR/RegA family two-component response regulator